MSVKQCQQRTSQTRTPTNGLSAMNAETTVHHIQPPRSEPKRPDRRQPSPNLFFFLKENGTKSVTDQCPNLNTKTGQPNRSSRKTSCSEGMFTPVLGCGHPFRRDNAKALAALHARMLLHLLNQAALTLFCIRTGAVSALALARHLKNCAVSADQRPPVTAASTTSRARSSSPANSGYVASFVLRACSCPRLTSRTHRMVSPKRPE